jgi:hypothetical protein
MDTADKVAIGLVLVFVGFIGMVFVALFMGLGFPINGEHSGYITAVSKGGMFGTQELYFKTDNQSSQEDKYCVTSDEIMAEAKQYQESKERVTLTFSRGFVLPAWTCSAYEIIDKIEISQ